MNNGQLFYECKQKQPVGRKSNGLVLFYRLNVQAFCMRFIKEIMRSACVSVGQVCAESVFLLKIRLKRFMQRRVAEIKWFLFHRICW